MTLIEQIKADQVNARKNRTVTIASLLTTLIGEAEMVGKNKRNGAPTDEEVQAVVVKFIKNNNEITNNPSVDTERKEQAAFEVRILSAYLPKQLTEEELTREIRSIIDDLTVGAETLTAKDMGSVMKELKVRHGGSYGGKLASTIVKECLQHQNS